MDLLAVYPLRGYPLTSPSYAVTSERDSSEPYIATHRHHRYHMGGYVGFTAICFLNIQYSKSTQHSCVNIQEANRQQIHL